MSKKSFGLEKLIEDVLAGVEQDIRFTYERLEGGPCGSPIERLFLVGLSRACRNWLVTGVHVQNFYEGVWPVEEVKIEHLDLHVWQQERVIDWPVDFLIGIADENGKHHFAVVECDGHDFHERTKEQAARDRSRDRALQQCGYRIFRFTGSEIYRDPIACIHEVLEWALQVWEGGQ